MSLSQRLLAAAERGVLPDALIRAGIRRLCRARLRELGADPARRAAALEQFVADMDRAPLALVPEKANEQHYELPPAFLALCLGARRKYSSCWFPPGIDELDRAEEAALEQSCARAELEDGQRILELGCGWGSLTLWMAERYPRASITALSNSTPQRLHIESELARRGLRNVRVLTADINGFETAERFHRVVSIEMFEHLRNWRELFARIARWLEPGGKLWFHVFCHRDTAYAFETAGEDDWMGRYFFSGGMMPSDDLALRFQRDLELEARWRWDGTHYQRTAEAWLANLDRRRAEALPLLEQVYGAAEAPRWLQRWRMFFLACAELFGFAAGREWWVAHYRLARR
ncbi:MAG: class I SAM-dependent methyltransferase [Planctomycetes bacterium]|nr:class I SAM-dependent methyltransferase [Planctomycetota bacterium]